MIDVRKTPNGPLTPQDGPQTGPQDGPRIGPQDGPQGAPPSSAPASVPRAPGKLELFTFRRLVQYGSVLALINLLALCQDVWGAQLALIPLLLTVPGCLLLHALRVPGEKVAAFPLYVPAASLIALMGSGLAVDLIGPRIGVDEPLRPAPMLIGLQITCLLLFLAGVPAPPETALPWRRLPSASRLAVPMLLPLVAAAGALRMNNGHGTAVAVLAVVACVAALIAVAVLAHRLTSGMISILLFAVGLALMWSYSLRGQLVYGFDIASEYATVHQTVAAGVWELGPHPDAYGAMLAITVLPAELHALSGLSELMVLKMVYPAVFAMFAVGIFNIAERFLPRRWAALTAIYVLVQGGLTQQLPALARQEIALLMFVALCAAVLDIGMPRVPRVALAMIFGPGIVVSHYSSAYFAILMLAGAVCVQVLLWLVRRTAAIRWTVAAALVTAIVSAFLWYVPLTQSASNLGQLRGALNSDGLQVLPRSEGKGLIAGWLAGGEGTTITAAEYQREVREKYAEKKYITPAEDAGRYPLRDSKPPAPAKRAQPISALIDLAVLLTAQLANLLALAAALLMVFERRSPGLTRQVGLLAVPALGCLVLFRVSGTLAATYNQGRAQIQALAVVSVALFWMLHRVAPRVRRIGVAVPVRRLDLAVWGAVAMAVLTIFVKSSGVSNVVLGGGTAANLSASGEDVERFYMYSPELAAARWLAVEVRGSRDMIYADRYGQVRLFSQMGTTRSGMITDLAPTVMNQNAWVYATRVNVVNGRARSMVDNSLATYAFPAAFIRGHYDVVYTNGVSEVFHR